MKITLCASAIGVAMLTGYGLSAPPAQAGYVVTLTQQGSDVVATGSGPIDLSGLTFSSGSFTFAEMTPSIADITTGPILVFTATDTYTGVSGPLNFGGGSPTDASSGNGDSVSIFGGINSLSCHGATSPTAPCRTLRPTPARPSAPSARPPASMNGRGARERTRISRSKSALLSPNPPHGQWGWSASACLACSAFARRAAPTLWRKQAAPPPARRSRRQRALATSPRATRQIKPSCGRSEPIVFACSIDTLPSSPARLSRPVARRQSFLKP